MGDWQMPFTRPAAVKILWSLPTWFNLKLDAVAEASQHFHSRAHKRLTRSCLIGFVQTVLASVSFYELSSSCLSTIFQKVCTLLGEGGALSVNRLRAACCGRDPSAAITSQRQQLTGASR